MIDFEKSYEKLKYENYETRTTTIIISHSDIIYIK